MKKIIFLTLLSLSTIAVAEIRHNEYGEAYERNDFTDFDFFGNGRHKSGKKWRRAPQYDRDTGNSRYDHIPARKRIYDNNGYYGDYQSLPVMPLILTN